MNHPPGMQMYQNTGYTVDRRKKQTLVLDIGDSDTHTLGTAGDFSIDLYEPLLIGKASEIYLDNLITYNANIAATPETSAFCLKINEFNIQTNVASNETDEGQASFNSLIIPNTHSSSSQYFGAVVHKAKKYNYVCDINPGKIGRLSGKITDLNGNPIFHGGDPLHKFTYALVGVGTWTLTGSGKKRVIEIGEALTMKETTASETFNITLANTTHFSAPTIIFYTKEALTASQITNITLSKLEFTTSSPVYNFFIAEGDGHALVTYNSRFLAEFTIISKE